MVDYNFYLSGSENTVPVLITQQNQFSMQFGVMEYPAAKYLGGIFKGQLWIVEMSEFRFSVTAHCESAFLFFHFLVFINCLYDVNLLKINGL